MSARDGAQRYMQRALELARRGLYSTHPNPRVGCVIVRDGEVVGEGWHERAGGPHAEVGALAQAGERARGADIYVTLEPCSHQGRTPPCVDALISAGVRRLCAATRDPNPMAGRGVERLRAAGVEVNLGLCEAEARELNRGFFSRITCGRPWVTLKLAASADGRTAMANGESQWITGAQARSDVHRLRAQAGAVLTTSATVLADDPALTVRDFSPASEPGASKVSSPSSAPHPGPFPASQGEGERKTLVRQPDRIVLDTHARVPASAKVWNDDGARKFWITARSTPSPANSGGGPGWGQIGLDASGHVAITEALAFLATQEINEVLVECGPRFAGALLQQALVDELVLYLAPSFLGHDARPLALLPGLAQLDQAVKLQWLEAVKIGADLRLIARTAPLETM